MAASEAVLVPGFDAVGPAEAMQFLVDRPEFEADPGAGAIGATIHYGGKGAVKPQFKAARPQLALERAGHMEALIKGNQRPFAGTKKAESPIRTLGHGKPTGGIGRQ